MDKEKVIKNTILRSIVGSTLFGLNTPDSDVDEMGICMEDIEYVAGLRKFEQYEDPEADIVIYGLKKYISLALNGNPTVLTLLFTPPSKCSVRTSIGAHLQELAPAIISRRAGAAFLGYLKQQRDRLAGLRGQKNVTRIDLIEKYGFDTKYAMHMQRLGFQGIEFIKTGRMSFPMQEPERQYLLDVRYGKYSLWNCLERTLQLEAELKQLIDKSPLPDEPDYERVEKWMVSHYLEWWKASDTSWKEFEKKCGVGDTIITKA